jgi:hypothetical protein
LILFYLLDGLFEGNLLRLGLVRKEHLSGGLVHRKNGVATRALNTNCGWFPVHMRTVYYGLPASLVSTNRSRISVAAWS